MSCATSRLVVPNGVALETQRILLSFCGDEGPHEGLVLWAGRQVERITMAMLPIVPDSDHGPQHVVVGHRAAGLAMKEARRHGLHLVAQVHSHPSSSTCHSDGDDSLILMPFEGYFSVVVGRYGRDGFGPGVGLHQYQSGRWVGISAPSESSLFVLPEKSEVT